MRKTIAALILAAAAVTGLTGCHVNTWRCPGTVASCVAGR